MKRNESVKIEGKMRKRTRKVRHSLRITDILLLELSAVSGWRISFCTVRKSCYSARFEWALCTRSPVLPHSVQEFVSIVESFPASLKSAQLMAILNVHREMNPCSSTVNVQNPIKKIATCWCIIASRPSGYRLSATCGFFIVPVISCHDRPQQGLGMHDLLILRMWFQG